MLYTWHTRYACLVHRQGFPYPWGTTSSRLAPNVCVEVQKLYGHGYDLISLSSTHSRERTLIASTCSAKSEKHAVVRLWDTSCDGPTWREVADALPHAHTLTVAQTEFSRDDRYLLAVGRDRSFAVFQRDLESSECTSPFEVPTKYSWLSMTPFDSTSEMNICCRDCFCTPRCWD